MTLGQKPVSTTRIIIASATFSIQSIRMYMQKSKYLPAHCAVAAGVWPTAAKDFRALLEALLVLMRASEFSTSAKAKERIREAVKVAFPHVSTTWKPVRR